MACQPEETQVSLFTKSCYGETATSQDNIDITVFVSSVDNCCANQGGISIVIKSYGADGALIDSETIDPCATT